MAQPANSDSEYSDDEAELSCFGYFQDNIVGIQYYEGEVNKNEMVSLIREPENPYDRWAVRVDNVRGQRVGHLPRVLVCHLAPLMDEGLVVVEGIVPRGTNNVYKMPVLLHLFGEEQNRARVVARMRAAGKVLNDPSLPVGSPAGGGGGGGSGRGGASTSAAAAAVAPRLSQQQMEDSIDRLFDELLGQTGPRPRLNAGPEVLTPLYPHQQEALAWMVQRENSNGLPPFWEPRVKQAGGSLTYVSQLTNFIAPARPAPLRGGILADDMGLGKTLEVICLICTNYPGAPQPQFFTAANAEATHQAGGSGSGAAAAAEEAEEEGDGQRPRKRQKKGSKGAEPKGKGKAKAGEGAASGGQGEKKKKLGKLEQEAADRAAAEESPASPPPEGGPKATLIVCPLSVMSNWAAQIEEHCAGNLSVCLYHGPDRDERVTALSQHDVVITTYNILAQDVGLKNGACKVDWLRVVLDEAHTIKNPKTQMAKACHALKAGRRWAVTGTPLQNSLQDLHGVCRFLHLEPLDDRSLFMRTIERPIKQRDPTGLKRLQVLMASIALRRTKDHQVNGRPLVALPPKTVHIVAVELDRVSREKHERWQEAGRRIIQQHLNEGTLLTNYTMVLEILLRLRQICCHASLAPGEDPTFLAQQSPASAQLTPELAAQLQALLKEGLEEDCPICLDVLRTPVITLCKHIFCRRCIDAVMARDKPSCPMCRGHIAAADLVELPEEEPDPTQADASPAKPADGAGSSAAAAAGGPGSAKVTALLQQLREDAAAGAKSIVFSQFTSFLDVVGTALAAEGFATGRLDGKTSAKRRAELLRTFQSGVAGAPSVLLVSLKAGGVGLNLTAASRVHMLDPWWNPAVEEQAMDRVHRLGQTRDVHIFRYCVKDSIEERILALQEQKRDLMKVAFDRRRPEEVREMRINDVRLLMDL
ncbi:hypothetical protein ABPG75_013372 [Micractinium tetrahymenae]